MNEVREVHHYDETSTNSTWLAVLVIAIVVAAGIMIAMWQPWAAPVRSDTTIIRDAPNPAPTTVINPPAASSPPIVVTPPKTDINVKTETAPPVNNSSDNSGSSDTATGTTGD